MSATTTLPASRLLDPDTNLVGDQWLRVKDGTAVYLIRELTDDQAADLGCPGANVVLVSRHTRTHIVGTSTEVTGRYVKFPGWAGVKGVLVRFVPWQAHGAGDELKGWVAP